MNEVTWELVGDWLKHPVTKVLVLLVAAELAREAVLRHGAGLLGLGSDAAGTD